LGFASVPVVLTVQQNNDNVPAPQKLDNNITVAQKRFDSLGPIDIEFTVQGSEGVTEYQVAEFVDNNTGTPWSGYRMQLGHFVAGNFVLSPINDGLDFDFPDYDTFPSSGPFPVVGTPDEDELVFSGGVHGGGAQPYNFRIDVPDLSQFGGKFVLRQIPVGVPEPGTFALALFAVFGLATRRKSPAI
jgi:hypothetical protein